VWVHLLIPIPIPIPITITGLVRFHGTIGIHHLLLLLPLSPPLFFPVAAVVLIV
jgi:hypothetical protein